MNLPNAIGDVSPKSLPRIDEKALFPAWRTVVIEVRSTTERPLQSPGNSVAVRNSVAQLAIRRHRGSVAYKRTGKMAGSDPLRRALAALGTCRYNAPLPANVLRHRAPDWNSLKDRLTVGRSVAQPGSALASGARGRRFESSRSDQSFQRLYFLRIGRVGLGRHAALSGCKITRSSAAEYPAAMDQLNFKTGMNFDYGEPAPMGPAIVRIVAPNAGPFTFKGTNTYLVGSTSLAVIDPGPNDACHLQAILKAAGPRPITHILTTHAHRDHVDGVAALKAATGATVCGFARDRQAARIALEQTPSGSYFVDYDFTPDHALAGGDVVTGADWGLTAIHTPGHAPDHLAFALDGRGVVFSGDHVMAWNTTVVAPPEGRMADYIASLEILLDREDNMFLPGHGGRLEGPQRTVKAYLLHRRWREQAVLKALRDGATSIRAIVPEVYQGLNPQLTPAATLSVQAHVEHLIEKGLVASDAPLTLDRRLEAV